MNDFTHPISLTVPLDPAFLSVVTGVAEKSALAYGLDQTAALSLNLAVEEIFSYLTQISRPEERFRLEIMSGGYYARIKLSFSSRDLDLHLFNLTAKISLDEESGLNDLGLFLAARSVDRFLIQEDFGQGLQLILTKGKKYPEETLPSPPSVPLEKYKIALAQPEQIKVFSRMLRANYPAHFFPPGFGRSGQLVDMIAGDEYSLVVAVGDRNQVGGGLVWKSAGQLAQSYGPYLFGQPTVSPMATDLIETCLKQVAKTEAIGLVTRYSTPELPPSHFEILGQVELYPVDGLPESHNFYYRQLAEDAGGHVWGHPRLTDFLNEHYQRLYLPREIGLVTHEGEELPKHSVLGTEIDRLVGQVTLRPIRDGVDFARNLADHLDLFAREGLMNVSFLLDLGLAWQAALTPILLDAGLRPQLILPYGGRSDLVVFQRRPD